MSSSIWARSCSSAGEVEEAGAGGGDGPPSPGRVVPVRCLDFRDAAVHADAPRTGVDEPMMVPAEEHAVVGVGGAASGVFGDVVDLAPGGGRPASGYHAAAVTEGDGAALVPVEHALFDAEPQDPSPVIEEDSLDDAGAGDVAGGEDRGGFV